MLQKRSTHCNHREDLLETRLKLLESQMVQNMCINSSLFTQLSLQMRSPHHNPSSYPFPPYHAQNPYTSTPYHGQNQVHQHYVPHPVHNQLHQPYAPYPFHNHLHRTFVPYSACNQLNQYYVPHHGQPPQMFTGVHPQARTFPDISQGYRTHPIASNHPTQALQNWMTNAGNSVSQSSHLPQACQHQQQTLHPNIMTPSAASLRNPSEAIPLRNHTVYKNNPLYQPPAGRRSQQHRGISSNQNRIIPQNMQSINSIDPPTLASKENLQPSRTTENTIQSVNHEQSLLTMSALTSEKLIQHTTCAIVHNKLPGQETNNSRTEVFDQCQQLGHISIPSKNNNPTVEEKNHLFQEMSLTEQPPDQLLQEKSFLIGRTKTFFHHSGQSSSQIDYIFSSKENLFKKYTIWNNSPTNVSAHVPVTVTTSIAIPTCVNKTNQEIQTVYKLQWDQTDLPLCIESVQNEISKLQLTQKPSNSIQKITDALLTASSKAVPTKPIKLKECKYERKNSSLYLASVDVQSAFDVVHHLILHDKLLDRNIHPDMWLVIEDLYSGLTTKVKWQGELSDSFNILQDIRRGSLSRIREKRNRL
ncbi:unnamed protein product [Mytilus coruscus]|uniref:Reverse transcriptase domain-containing protein n=1 Tax=Mytilus coruscus TaxID=42192 RepID=A0A6J8DPP8_MYTCO|nr:unnamed protein product [Mytilus coruscus]